MSRWKGLAGVQEAVRCWKSCEVLELANQNIIHQVMYIKRGEGSSSREQLAAVALVFESLSKIMCLNLKATESVENLLEPKKNF